MSLPRHSEPLPLGTSDHPYSKGLMARALVAVGVPLGRAYELAKRIDQDLVDRCEQSTDLERVEELAVEVMGEEEGSEAVRRLRRYRELHELDLPVIVLVGGATGTGKSTVATEAAYRLGITRVTSTDFVRQTMRAFFSEEFMPSIHYSSFEAAAGLREPEQADDPVIAGFLEQTRNVLVGVRASIERALQEGWSIILEGVHIVPGLLPTYLEGALVCPFILAIEDETAHAQHFFSRGSGRRPLAPYLDHFEEIRRLQRFLAERAEREAVPVIENESADETTDKVIRHVLAAAAKYEAHV
jgi:2-phosphoglycerate kinase